MESFIRSVDLKLERAKRQASDLRSAIQTWQAVEPLRFAAELREQRLGLRLKLAEITPAPPLDDWSLCFGEIVHNLRSALDNLAFAIARLKTDPPAHPKKIQFPIFTTRKAFREDGTRRSFFNQIPPPVAAKLEQLQPFMRDGSAANGLPEEDLLHHLHWYSNKDKHQVPHLVQLVPTVASHQVSIEFRTPEEAIKNEPPDLVIFGGPLVAGASVMEWRTKHPVDKITGTMRGESTIAIQPPTGTLAPVVTVADLIVTYSQTVVDELRTFFVT